MGYRHIDCAAASGNEKEVGKAIAEAIDSGVITREELWITSKLWSDSHGKNNVEPALIKSLKDLQLDYLDLYLVHWPVAFKKGVEMPEKADQFIPLEEVPLTDTWAGMEAALEKGLAKHIGVSNFNTQYLKALLETATQKPEVNQIEIHPFLQQDTLVDFCKQVGIHLTAYAPIGSGGAKDDDLNLFKNGVLLEIAQAHGMTVAQVVLKWGIQRGISVIPKSTNVSRLQENLDTLKFELSASDMEKIAALNKDHRFVDGKFWEVEGGPYTAEEIWNA
ncbi:aldo/keto reductase, partial [Flavobacterium beibuense]|uniref:aldo/keto reductase n=1 Tax=Flavobacterium beibuense TaxID=657326 RepID=UPI003A8DB053